MKTGRRADIGSRDLEALLLEAGREEKPPRSSLRKTLAATGVGAASLVVGASGSASTGVVGVGALGVMKAFGVGLVVMSGALGAHHLATDPPAVGGKSASVAVVSSAASATALDFASDVAADAAVESESEEPEVAPVASVLRARVLTPPAVASAPASGSALVEEYQRLDRARQAIQRGDANEGLALLGEYERSGRERQLTHEAVLLRAEALSSQNRCGELRRVVESFLAREPSSVVARRMRSLVRECREPDTSK